MTPSDLADSNGIMIEKNVQVKLEIRRAEKRKQWKTTELLQFILKHTINGLFVRWEDRVGHQTFNMGSIESLSE